MGELDATWARIAAAAERLGLEAAARATYRGSSNEDTAAVLERLTSEHPSAPSAAGFEPIDMLGRGGMGVVLRARQSALERDVALKKLATADENLYPAFFSEAQIMGRLEHANVPPVHALARDAEGIPVLAMKLVKGVRWSEIIREGRLSIADHVRLLMSVANAVAFAHSRGIIHRDLKPDNVMVGDFGEVYVMDWGVAATIDKSVSADSAILHVRDMPGPLGTPRYMAPELAEGDASRQDARTDVYLLGACLHEVLTGQPLHRGATIAEIRARAVLSEPAALGPEVPRELGEICLRATACRSDERFADAGALRDALSAYLDHREALALTETGAALGAALRRALSSREETQRIERMYHEASFAFRRALEIWPGAAEARAGLGWLHDQMLRRALDDEDLPLARRILAELDAAAGAVQRREVRALERRLARRQRELAALRAAERRRDWQHIAKPLSEVFAVAAIAGGVAGAFTRPLLGRDYALMAMWLGVTALSGIVARIRLSRAALGDHLASPRVFAIWAAVALGILLHGAVEHALGTRAFSQPHVVSFMLGIGFAATAVHTRRWLLIPAAAWFVGGVAMGASAFNVEIFGVLWLLTLGGVAIALERGARLDDEDPN